MQSKYNIKSSLLCVPGWCLVIRSDVPLQPCTQAGVKDDEIGVAGETPREGEEAPDLEGVDVGIVAEARIMKGSKALECVVSEPTVV